MLLLILKETNPLKNLEKILNNEAKIIIESFEIKKKSYEIEFIRCEAN